MIKKVLLALAAVLATAFAARCAIELFSNHIARRLRAERLADRAGFSQKATYFFLNSIEKLGIDIDLYSDEILIGAMINGFVWKFTEEN